MEDGRVLEFGPVRDLLSDKESAFRRMAEEAGIVRSERESSPNSRFTST